MVLNTQTLKCAPVVPIHEGDQMDPCPKLPHLQTYCRYRLATINKSSKNLFSFGCICSLNYQNGFAIAVYFYLQLYSKLQYT